MCSSLAASLSRLMKPSDEQQRHEWIEFCETTAESCGMQRPCSQPCRVCHTKVGCMLRAVHGSCNASPTPHHHTTPHHRIATLPVLQHPPLSTPTLPPIRPPFHSRCLQQCRRVVDTLQQCVHKRPKVVQKASTLLIHHRPARDDAGLGDTDWLRCASCQRVHASTTPTASRRPSSPLAPCTLHVVYM